MTIFVVSGYRRSGTSMMMKALHKGGLPVISAPGQDKIGANEIDGYVPSPSGVYEVGQMWYMRPKHQRLIPDNALVKILFDGLPHLPKGEYKIIWMVRGVKEIKASCERVDRHLRQEGVKEHPERTYPFDSFRDYSQEDMDHVLGICKARTDMEAIEVHFRDVIGYPGIVFENLKKIHGIPIDVSKAVSVINRKHYRYRIRCA